MATEMEQRKRRKYTLEERNEILDSVDKVGVVEAARHHKVPQTTVSNWLNRDAATVGRSRVEMAAATNGAAVRALTPNAVPKVSTAKKPAKTGKPGNATVKAMTPSASTVTKQNGSKLVVPKPTTSNASKSVVAKPAKPAKPTTSNASKSVVAKPAKPTTSNASKSVVAKPAKVTTPNASKSVVSKAAKPKATQLAGEMAAAVTNGSRKLVARSYTPSEKAQALEHAAAHGVSATSEKFGMSRFSIYDWQRKLEKANAGEGPSPTSGPAPQEIEEQRDREILGEWRKHPGLGPSQIKNQLRRRGVKVSVTTARRVMENAGYRPPKVKREPHDERFEAVRPNHMWHLDYVHRHINRAETHTLILIDDCARFVTGHGVDDAERAQLVIDTFEEAVKRHGKPESVMHDRGSAFWSWRGISRFTALLTELGIDQVVAEDKEHNGKIEVFNANLAKELFDRHRFYDLAEMKRRLATHLRWYNHGRTHHALGGLLVPADRYYGRTEEVLARIEAGGSNDGDELELRDRCLELFKVVSKNGAPEVWLLGRRLTVPALP